MQSYLWRHGELTNGYTTDENVFSIPRNHQMPAKDAQGGAGPPEPLVPDVGLLSESHGDVLDPMRLYV